MNEEIVGEEITYKEKNIFNVPLEREFVQRILNTYDVGHTINDFDLFQRAFTHKSYVMMDIDLDLLKRNPKKYEEQKHAKGMELRKPPSYDILEFYGDAILEEVVSSYILDRYPNKGEGFYSDIRKKLVCNRNLMKISIGLGFDKYLLISKHEEEDGSRAKCKMLADMVEAFIGAIAYDVGKDKHHIYTYNFIVGVMEDFVNFAYLVNHDDNYKTQLIHYYNDKNAGKLRQSIVELKNQIVHGKREVTMAVKHINGDYIGIGIGCTRKQAEQQACKHALLKLGVINKNSEWVSDSEDESD
jgi:ribonuclease III